MIGIIIVTHGNLALELKSAMEHILGIQKNIEIISIKSDDDLEIKKADLEEAIEKTTRTFSIKSKKQEYNLIDALKIVCRKYSKEMTGKKPFININLVQI